MSNGLTLNELKAAVAGTAAAFRCRRQLQPAGGAGDKVFPPTFAGAVYAVEQRRVSGREEPVTCVLLDSVQSQANRMELALQEAVDAGRVSLPLIAVDFSEFDDALVDPIGRVTSLQVPHRIADAILRDSELNGRPFRESDKGKTLNRVSLANAAPLLEHCPTALVFGMWDSTGPKGGLGVKFERAMVSEVVGIGAEIHDSHRSRGVRRDPLEIRRGVAIQQAPDKSWIVADSKAKGVVRPSQINHGSVPFDSQNAGVTIEYAEQTTTLSLICLRRLRFPVSGKRSDSADQAAQTLIAALGLCAATLAFESGMGLRSRCLLWPEGAMEWELLDRPGEKPRRFTMTSDEVIALLAQAAQEATDAGLPWPIEPVVLKPSAQLLELVQRSQQLAKAEAAGEGD